MQPTLLLLCKHVLNACDLAQMHLKVKVSTFMNHWWWIRFIIFVRSNLFHVHAKCGNYNVCQNEHIVFPIPELKPILNHSHWNTLEYHYITHSHAYTMCISFHMCPPWSATTHGTHLIFDRGHWTSLMHHLTFMNY
jgi:hypothetical protein